MTDCTPQAVIHLAALRHNLQQVRQQAPNRRIWAVVKANAYGHGLVRTVTALKQADGFALARMPEALTLRQIGIQHPLLVLEGPCSQEELLQASQHQIQIVLHHASQLVWLEQSSLPYPLHVWLKVDTGMHRLGFPVEQAASIYQRLQSCKNVAGQPAWITHLANADQPTDPLTQQQIQRLYSVSQPFGGTISITNSAGILAWPDTHQHWIRPGIMLYGVSPFSDDTANCYQLRPAMTLGARLIAINHLQAGDAIGYGGTYRCPQSMPVGVVSIGYGDGYPRHAANGTPVLIHGQRVPLIGRVSMDMITVDLRQQPQAKIGDKVILWGQGLPVEEIAKSAGTIGYELLCGVTARVRILEQDEH